VKQFKTLIDGFLNHVTMYRLVLYYVGALLLADFALGFAGLAPNDPAQLAASTLLMGLVGWSTNLVMAKAFRVPANSDSVYITVGILALIMPPVATSDLMGLGGLALASFAAIASKFVLAVFGKHIFNPVALGVVVAYFALDQSATWWVGGNLELLPIVLLGGLLILRKVQRFEMFGAYVLANLVATAATTSPAMYGEAFVQTFLHSPLLFAGFAMLTEPLTAPAKIYPSLIFGAIVGALSSPNVHIGEFYFTPELGFLIGNAFAWAVSPKFRYRLTLDRIEKKARGVYDYVFRSNRPIIFEPGQYLDWTLNVRSPDNRGNRRSFTIASAPSESEVRLGLKFYPDPSSFKQGLLHLKPGQTIFAGQLSGEFILPKNVEQKLAFIAGGIGVTPFRSMVQDLMDRRETRDIVMFYGNNSADEIAYREIFDAAGSAIGLRNVYVVAEAGAAAKGFHEGFIDKALIARMTPDFEDRMFYLSGPRSMVVRFENVLAELGVPWTHIKTDFFPGFA
jgi:ferredoxin-NADP reductase/Na+-translocating ferredoxin:NAD+ oxidoreductase RnfD subunit